MNKGFVSTIILIIIALLTLQFAFHIDVLAILQSPPMLAISHFVIKYSVIAWNGLVDLYQTVTT
jgi:hypothetical protein